MNAAMLAIKEHAMLRLWPRMCYATQYANRKTSCEPQLPKSCGARRSMRGAHHLSAIKICAMHAGM